uniref:Uncharacterized protein n=1 Tax=Panagrolaimus superbus TaxID=310955 RepID=A0A914Y4S9_9BILA
MEHYFVLQFVVKVKVTNFHGQTLYGNLIPDNTVIENVKLVREDVEWYLIYNNYGYVDVTRRLDLSAEHYLLAEMMPENGKKFHDAASCKIEIV